MKINLNAGNPFADDVSEEEEQPAKAVYVPPFTIVVDTREQAGFRFIRLPATAKEGGGYVVPRLQTDKGLKTGDYSIVGMEEEVCIERKSLPDLFACCGRERDRFEREFERMVAMKWSAVVVEGGEADIIHRAPRGTKITPEQVLGTIESWSIRYPGTHWFLCCDRRQAEIRTYRLLARCWSEFGPVNKGGDPQ